ncbi:DegV family protein with EDD domain [Arthrobacter pigmenti]|uniref:DegV family protein with EDD domain n=1 Tax=Arthrobacter pigmenti TaxID=271432 RepID=A0A846RMU7_9MICC|nr:DegV family protein [Arthrobacter pigmenti]NJC22429.1 DegV family protein with EDD domain [Arthrobacter pigmenti]
MRWFERRPAPWWVTRDPEAGPGTTTAVVTDSAAALPNEWVTGDGPAVGVTIVPMPVIISGRHYGEGSDNLIEPLSVALAEGADVRTSRPAPGQFQSVYRRLEAEGAGEIVSIHLSGKLSGTVDAARWAARSVSIPVHVVDSATVAMAQGAGVASACLALRNGADAQEAAKLAAETCSRTRLLFYVPSLDQLRRGGRIGPAAGMIGTLLSVKPILTVKDGAIEPLERIRTAARAKQRLDELVVAELRDRPEGSIAAFHYFGNRAQAEAAAARILGDAEPVLTRLPAVLAAHTGLGVLAVAVCDPLRRFGG